METVPFSIFLDVTKIKPSFKSFLFPFGKNVQQVAKSGRNPSYSDEISGQLGTGRTTAV